MTVLLVIINGVVILLAGLFSFLFKKALDGKNKKVVKNVQKAYKKIDNSIDNRSDIDILRKRKP